MQARVVSEAGLARKTHHLALDLLELTKPRITLLVLITTLTGMWLAAKGELPLPLTLFTLLGMGLAVASASTLNNYFDRDVDALMPRTQRRALPAGRVKPAWALILGAALGVLSFVVLAILVNLLSAVLALGANLYYIAIYTCWLKRTTPHCTVLGGAAGALPPVIGWAAVTNRISLEALVLFGILFIWQPPHFWALALGRRDEYARAGLPMLPVVRGEAATKRQILLYSIALVPISPLLYPLGLAGPIYAGVAVALSTGFILLAAFVQNRAETPWAKHLFFYSLFYLAALFLALVLDCRC